MAPGVPLQGQRTRCHRCAIVGCHCSVLWLGGTLGGVDVVPLLGAIAGCHCSVLSLWGTTNFGEWTCAIAGCHCAIVVCYGGGRGLQGAIVVCYGLGGG